MLEPVEKLQNKLKVCKRQNEEVGGTLEPPTPPAQPSSSPALPRTNQGEEQQLAQSWVWWYMPVIPVTWEARLGRLWFAVKVRETLSQKHGSY
jgi:capsular polysaccharide biosynthesis protein